MSLIKERNSVSAANESSHKFGKYNSLNKIFEACSQTPQRSAEKEAVRQQMESEIRRFLYPNCRLLSFGSTVTEFGLMSSDLDLMLVGHGEAVHDNSDKIVILEDVKKRVRKSGFILKARRYEVIDAKVPLFRAAKVFGKFNVELSVETNADESALRNTRLLSIYSHLDPRVICLGVLVKNWAEYHALCGTRHHKLSGYALALMAVFYLQRIKAIPCLQSEYPDLFDGFSLEEHVVDIHNRVDIPQRIRERKSDNPDAKMEELMKGFFSFYAGFDFESDAISVKIGRTVLREEMSVRSDYPRQWSGSFIAVEDPFKDRNVTSAVNCRATWTRILDTIKATSDKLNGKYHDNRVFGCSLFF